MTNDSRSPFFPMMIDIQNRDVLVIGGGRVAARRARTLLLCGARVHAVSPKFCDDFPDVTERFTRAFEPHDVDAKFMLIIAATNSRATNHLVHELARAKGIPVNVSDSQSECDFFFPSLVAHDSVGVSVCTAGISSRLTRKLSDRLRSVWDVWVEEER